MIIRSLYRFGGWLLFLAATLEFFNILSRILHGPTLDMGASLAGWLVAWAVFLTGGPLLLERGGHVAIMAIPNWLGGRIGRGMERVSLLVLLLGCAMMAYSGWLMTQSLMARGVTYAFAIRVPQYLVKSSVSIGFAIATLCCVVALYRSFRHPDGAKDGDHG